MQKTIATLTLAATIFTSFAFALPVLADVNVTTNPATDITSSEATLNATNGPVDASMESFWVSLAPIDVTTSSMPAGVYSTPTLPAVAANGTFSDPLSLVTTQGIPENLPPITPETTYYFVAWANVGGSWYHGDVLNFTTLAETPPTLPGTLSAEDFGVVNYDSGGNGILAGYTAGFGLTDNTFAGASSVVVKLYSAGDTLLQTNTAILPQFNADITGTQFSSPFDVSGTFNYATDGYWTNVKEAEFGQSVPAVKVVATVTLANGKVVTAENTLLTGDPTSIYPPPPTICDENATQTIVSDTTNTVNGSDPAVATYDLNPAWVPAGTLGSGAMWIWNTAQVTNPEVAETNVFTKTFSISGTVNSANIEMAVDNGYILKVNGDVVIDNSGDEFNYGTTANYDVASYLQVGVNTLEITVDNLARPGSTYQSNPAGLLYKLVINSDECEEPQPTPSVTTDPATLVTQTSATVNGTNGPVDADDTSFWLGTTPAGPFVAEVDPTGQLPVGWSGVDTLAQLANVSFSHSYTGLTPNTQYYFVAWSLVGGTWYPGEVLNFTTPIEPTICDENVSQTIVSDMTTTINGNPSVATYDENTAWDSIIGATWIWDTAQVTDPEVEKTNVFTKTFNISGNVTSANIEMATDNGYILKINGNVVVNKITEEFNYGTTVNHDVASFLQTGPNTLEITVKNFALAGSTFESNPAGLIYKLVINSDECEEPEPTPNFVANPNNNSWNNNQGNNNMNSRHRGTGSVLGDSTSYDDLHQRLISILEQYLSLLRAYRQNNN